MKTTFEKPPLTWNYIEKNLKNLEDIPPDETDKEKLEYFKGIINDHLDNLQKEEDKKIIVFPKK